MNIRFKITFITLFVLLFIFNPASSVNLSNNNLGQVLLIPYYNVEDGNETLISITNTTDRAKAVRIYIREGDNGQTVLQFNIYLSAYDVWNAKITEIVDAGAQIVSYDKSCTVPTLPSPPSGVPFRSYVYLQDGGDTSIARTREGFIEFIEMGIIESGSAEETALTHVDGIPSDCSLLNDNWNSGGKWDLDSQASIEPPTGGLIGSSSILNVSTGDEHAEPITALDNFSSTSLHDLGADFPSFDSADPHSIVLLASNDLTPIFSDNWVRGIDAVSAVLIKKSIMNRYAVNPTVEFETDWVVSFPTKHFYTQASASAPFTSVFGATGACEASSTDFWDREETSGTSLLSDLCYVTNVINFGSSNVLHAIRNKIVFAIAEPTGWASINFNQSMTTPEGYTYQGLPSIGFAVSRAGNSNVGKPYSNVTPHSSTAIHGNPRVALAGDVPVPSLEPYDNVTFVSTDRIYTDGPLVVSDGKMVTFRAPIVILGNDFKVENNGTFHIVSSL